MSIKEPSEEEKRLTRLAMSGELCSALVEMVHIKLGDAAFIEFVGTKVYNFGPFFYKWMKYELDYKQDLVPQAFRLLEHLKTLSNHPDARQHDIELAMARGRLN